MCIRDRLVTDVGDIMQYVEHGITGFSSPPGDIAQQRKMIRDALSLTRNDVEDMKRSCLNSRAFAVESYVHGTNIFLNDL